MPLLDCVPSKRVAERLFVALQGAKSLPPGHPEQYLAKMQEVAATEPAVAEVLARKQSGDGGTLTS